MDGQIEQIAKLEAKYEDRKAERDRRRQQRAQHSNPTENANAFWQVQLFAFCWTYEPRLSAKF